MSDFQTITDFTAAKFTPTKWDSAEKKAHFARQFIRFVESEFNESRFPDTFYRRLSLTFGHIAHYNRQGFFQTFFMTTANKVRFLRLTLRHHPVGDPEFTYSDVERALQTWLVQNGVLAKYEQRLERETEAAELAELERLKAKYASG